MKHKCYKCDEEVSGLLRAVEIATGEVRHKCKPEPAVHTCENYTCQFPLDEPCSFCRFPEATP